MHFDPTLLKALEYSHTQPRLEKYLAKASGDVETALNLYVFNTAISSAFYGPLQALEVTLRNALHTQLIAAKGQDWYLKADGWLDDNAVRKIEDASFQLDRQKLPIDEPHIVAELSFGFWVGLLGSGGYSKTLGRYADYETKLWRPYLRKAFPFTAIIKRKNVHRPLDYMRTFRNRIAHHEPIFARDLKADYNSILITLGMMCPHTASWVDSLSRVKEILDLGAGKVSKF